MIVKQFTEIFRTFFSGIQIMSGNQSQKLTTGLTGQLEQRQLLSQNMRRSLELLALPVTALESRLSAELASNPLLELPDYTAQNDFTAELPRENDTSSYDENDYENNAELPDEWANDLPLPTAVSPDDAKRDFIGSLPAPPPQLRTQLYTELSAMELPENILRCALEIVSALNDNGYLDTPLPDLAMRCDADMPEISTALDLVQKIAPPGVAARDLAECLKLQLVRSGKMTEKLALLLDTGLEDLQKNRLDRLAVKLETDMTELHNMLKTLRSLNPAPGKQNSPVTSVIIPDLIITRRENGDYFCTVNRPESSRLTISQTYEKLLDNRELSADDRAFLTEKRNSAKELIHSLAMRESTLKQLGDLLIARQKDFLDHGKSALKPLTMKDAAEKLNVNESTISRCVADKFADTPQGILPLKNFFTGGYDFDGTSEISNQAVMDKIRHLIDREDPFSPLSDEAIAQLLKKENIPVARRTVAKYRDMMDIPSSSLRKKFI